MVSPLSLEVLPPLSGKERPLGELRRVRPVASKLEAFIASSKFNTITSSVKSTEKCVRLGLTLSSVNLTALSVTLNASFESSAMSWTPPVAMLR